MEERAAPGPSPGSLFDVVRAFGVMSGGPAVLAGAVVACVWSAGRALRRGKRPPWPATAGLALLGAYAVVFRPWTRRWGATAEELEQALPGDEVVEDPGIRMTRAVTIDAPPERVWPWLAQIGQDRAGFYSYAWLENLAGCRLHNADRIHPEWQQREVGETVLLHPATGPRLARFDPNRAYAFEGGWYFALEPLPGGRTRLFARSRIPRGLTSLSYAVFIELPHFVMERRMLLGIKQRVEQATASPPAASSETTP
jgi:hypothetical protein